MAQNRPPFFNSSEKKTPEQPKDDSLTSYIAKKRIAKYEFAIKSKDDKTLRRIFQLFDSVYSDLLKQMELPNKKVLLHCNEKGNFGDIASTLFCAELIKKNRPECDITILFQLETLDEKTVANVFKTTAFKVEFAKDYYTKEQLLSQHISKSACVLGIAVGISSGLLYKTHHRVFYEYGYSWHSDTKDEILAMGLKYIEEGIMIPAIQAKSMNAIQTDWVKKGLQDINSIYHMHIRNWYLQILSLYQAITLEKDEKNNVVLVLPLVYPVQNYIDWGILDVKYLKELGIGRISCFTPSSIETIDLLPTGKELRILNGPIPKQEMEIIQQHSQNFFGCGGDNSISECIALGKIPFYDGTEHKSWFFDSLIDLAKELKLEKLARMYELLEGLIKEVKQIYTENTPVYKGFYKPEPSFELSKADSVTRKSVVKISPKLTALAKEFAPLCSDTALVNDAQTFSRFIKENLNMETRLLASVDRGLILGNYPEMIEVEKQLWEEFRTGKLKIENLHTAFVNAISGLRLGVGIQEGEQPDTKQNKITLRNK